MEKQVSPLLTLDVVNGAHKRIPLKTVRGIATGPKKGKPRDSD